MIFSGPYLSLQVIENTIIEMVHFGKQDCS